MADFSGRTKICLEEKFTKWNILRNPGYLWTVKRLNILRQSQYIHYHSQWNMLSPIYFKNFSPLIHCFRLARTRKTTSFPKFWNPWKPSIIRVSPSPAPQKSSRQRSFARARVQLIATVEPLTDAGILHYFSRAKRSTLVRVNRRESLNLPWMVVRRIST